MKKILLVGLGNPGTRYRETRHNLGANVVEAWVRQVSTLYPGAAATALHENDHLHAAIAEISLATPAPTKIVVVLPRTFMNESGQAVAAAVREYHSEAADLLVIHDDIEVPLGEVRLKATGSAAGHNGVRSIQQTLVTDAFSRLRLGVGRPPENKAVDQFVLEPFTTEEAPVITALTNAAQQAITDFIASRANN